MSEDTEPIELVDDTELIEARNRVAELTAEIERLQLAHAEEIDRLQARVSELEEDVDRAAQEKLLPAVSKFEVQLSELSETNEKLLMALSVSEEQVEGLNKSLTTMEQQKEERDQALREEEVKRRRAEQKADLAQHAVAQIRMDYLRKGDPAAGEQTSVTETMRRRILAWLGDAIARVELGVDMDVCPLCRASPPCRVGDPPHVHGTLLPPKYKRFLRTLVEEAVTRGADPVLALETWAGGSTLTELEEDDEPAEKAAG